jgi:hypothetical protein
MRALITAIGLGANRPQDAVYPTSLKAADGDTYDSANKYVMHFPKGQLPPARGFWSLTMYDAEYFFVPNVLNRYSISPRQGLKANWLPAPPGKFVLMLRMYWPSEKSPSIINGSWTIPAVKKVS